MNLYTSLTLRYLKQNKKRTIVTIIGIILSTALICGIGNIFESLMDYQIRATVEDSGSFYATFNSMNKEEANIVSKSSGIKEYSYSKYLGTSKLGNKKDNLVEVRAFDKAMFDSYNITLKEGRLPKNDNEIVLSELFLSLSNKKIGDTIDLNIGKRVTSDGDELRGSWVSEDEKIIDSKRKEFKIVGIINAPGFEVGKQVINGITYLDINNLPANSTVDVSIITNSPKDIYEVAESISKTLGLKSKNEITEGDEDGGLYSYNNGQGIFYERLSFNEHLLRLKGASAYANIGTSMINIIILVTALVIICTIATVYNAFSISISERKKQFGILNSIGATKSQTMKLVFLEAFIVSIIGIPIGLISGTLAIDIVFKIIQNLFASSLIASLNLRIVYNPHIIILSAFIVLATIIISAILPAITASRISPLEAIKNSANLKVGKVKDSKIVKALFKAEGVLAYKNLRRNKKKFKITLFSLIISVVIFISFSGFMNLFMKAQNIQMGQMNYDLRLSKSGGSEDYDIVSELKNIKGIDRIANGSEDNITVNLSEDKVNKEYEDLLNNYYGKEHEGNENVYKIINSNIKLPGDMEISKIKLKEGEFNKKEAIKENGVILVNKSYYEETAKKSELELTDYKVGDTVSISKVSFDEDGNEIESDKNIDLKILAVTDEILTGSYSYNYMGLDFVTYDEVGKKLGFESTQDIFYVSSDKSEETRKEVQELCDQAGYYLDDQTQAAIEMEETLNVMNIFVYGFITVISLVSVTNIVNTISTNINLRKREFAIIKSIGVTPGGFNKIIYLESLLYGALALIYGIPIGIGVVAIMNIILSNVINFGLILPWMEIIISIVGIFVITFIASYIPMKKINKENIIENIRQESI